MSVRVEDAFHVLRWTGLGVIDIGSRDGLHAVFRDVAPLVDAVGFEPDVEECARLNTEAPSGPGYRSLTFLPFGLGSSDGHGLLHLCRSRGNSSLYRPNRRFLERFPDPSRFESDASVLIPIRSVDSMVDDPTMRSPKPIDFMKVDTQGAEIDILRGARKTLASQVVGVEVEVEFARLYDAQPLFRDVDGFLADCGFTLFKLRRVEWVRRPLKTAPERSAGQLVFGDALYLRDPVSHEAPWSPRDAHQAEALVLIAILYDLHDFAWEISSLGAMANLIDAEVIKRYILERSGARNGPIKTLARTLKAEWRAVFHGGRYERSWVRADSNFYSRW